MARTEERHADTRRDHEVHHDHHREVVVRGGISFGSILTGTAVAFGTIFVLSAVIGAIMVATGAWTADLTRDQAVQAGILGGILFLLVQFAAYLWGGYTAGRMARGAGVGNGLLVPAAGIVIAVLVGGIGAALEAETRFFAPFTDVRIPVEQDLLVNFGAAMGLATLVVMFLAGALGGRLGARWHDRLEAHDAPDRAEEPTA